MVPNLQHVESCGDAASTAKVAASRLTCRRGCHQNDQGQGQVKCRQQSTQVPPGMPPEVGSRKERSRILLPFGKGRRLRRKYNPGRLSLGGRGDRDGSADSGQRSRSPRSGQRGYRGKRGQTWNAWKATQ